MSDTSVVGEIKRYASKDFYWGLIPREEMQRFVASAEQLGFDEARRTFAFSMPFVYADNFDRADVHLFLPIPSNAHVLDLGSGFGNVTIPMSQHYARVTAADASYELLGLSRVRARDLGRTNIDFAHIDPLGSGPLPFADRSFDAVCLNGVLEWVGLSHPTESPRAIQSFVLSEIARVLRPGGVLYVGIENRWFPGWFSYDPHSKLAFTVALPRVLADWYAHIRGFKEGYRTYIYGYRSYKRLFRPYFSLEKTFIPFSSYRYPQVIYPHNQEASAYLFRHGFAKQVYTKKWYGFLKVLYMLGLHHWYLAAFMFVLRKGEGPQETALARILSERASDHYRPTDTLLKIKSKDSLKIAAIRSGETKPYGEYELKRGEAGAFTEVHFLPQ